MSGNETTGRHETVLLDEAVNALLTDSNGFYVDGTLGRGGHSAALLAGLSSSGRLLAIDRDPEAVQAGKKKFAGEQRIDISQTEFSNVGALVEQRGKVGQVSGILCDLGVSSPQIDTAERGFSFLKEGALDMRMSPDKGVSAADWLNSADLEEIVKVLKEFGEEKFARRIATAIVARQQSAPLITTTDLVALIDEAVPVKDPHKHPATRSFQAIRIHINDELGEVERMLERAIDILAPAGRLVVISFHSLEDRIVKRFMRNHSRPKSVPRDIPVTAEQSDQPRLRLVGKAVKPSAEEVARNPRARSAVMRVAEKLC